MANIKGRPLIESIRLASQKKGRPETKGTNSDELIITDPRTSARVPWLGSVRAQMTATKPMSARTCTDPNRTAKSSNAPMRKTPKRAFCTCS